MFVLNETFVKPTIVCPCKPWYLQLLTRKGEQYMPEPNDFRRVLLRDPDAVDRSSTDGIIRTPFPFVGIHGLRGSNHEPAIDFTGRSAGREPLGEPGHRAKRDRSTLGGCYLRTVALQGQEEEKDGSRGEKAALQAGFEPDEAGIGIQPSEAR